MPHKYTTSDVLRFQKYVKVSESGCHEWIGSLDAYGYGQLNINRRPAKAHRIAWELANGPVPEGMSILHRCDNPQCVNPEHLFPGTQSDNMKDAARKGRMHPGEKHGMSKLTESDVLAMRMAHSSGEGRRDIASRFNVPYSTVNEIIRRDAWKHI